MANGNPPPGDTPFPPGPSGQGGQPPAGQFPQGGAPGQFPPGGFQQPGQFPPGGAPGQFPQGGAPGQFPPGGFQQPGQFPPGGAPGQFPQGAGFPQGPGGPPQKNRGRTVLLAIVIIVVVVGVAIAGLQAAGIIDGSSSVDRLAVGDCVMVPDDMTEVARLTTTACTNPHDGEVFALAEAPGDSDAPYPFLTLDDIAVDACLAEFESYTGVDLFESDFDVVWLSPTVGSWSNGDRGITCIVTNVDESPLTGSVAQ